MAAGTAPGSRTGDTTPLVGQNAATWGRRRCTWPRVRTIMGTGGATRAHASPHRRLRLPVRLRELRARRAERQRRVAVPAADGLAERLRAPSSTATPAASGSAPTDVMVPAARRYLPGHDDPRDELGDADRLDHRARRPADRAVAPRATSCRRRTGGRRPTTTPSTSCCAPSAASTARCRSSMECAPVFDYGRSPAQLGLPPAGLPRRGRRRAAGVGLPAAPDHRHAPRLRGPAGDRAHAAEGGRQTVRRAVVERARRRRPPSTTRTARLDVDGASLAALARPRPVPRPPVARAPRAQRAHAQGPDVRADRGARRGGDDVAARDARRRAQLGLPLHLDPRLDARAVGALHARLRLGGGRLLLLHRRRRRALRRSCRSCTASTARGTSSEQVLDHLAGYGGSRPVRIGNGAFDQQQHDVWGAVLDSVYIHTSSRGPPRRPALADPVAGSSRRRSSTGASPTAGCGRSAAKPKHFTSSKVMCWVAADRGARLARIREQHRARRARGRRPPTRSTPTSARTASTSAASSPSTTGRRRSTPRSCWCRWSASCRPTTRGSRDRPRDRRRADRRRPRAALPGRGDRRRPVRRGGHVHDLLVLAGVGARR